MNFAVIGITVAVIGGVGLLLGLFLCFSDRVFAVPTDERIAAVRDCLPGSNCGGCGFAGCDALAKAIVAGEAPTNACVGCDDTAIAQIAAVMGVTAGKAQRRVAYVCCSGTCDKTRFRYHYYGSDECHRVAVAPGRGSKQCAYGCIGFGSCVKACPVEAIAIVNGCALVNREACIGCGKCMAACPNRLIELIPYEGAFVVACRSQEKGRTVRLMCDAGCIGCGLCAKLCPTGAIALENNIAHIDLDVCSACGKCAEKCPAKVIHFTAAPVLKS